MGSERYLQRLRDKSIWYMQNRQAWILNWVPLRSSRDGSLAVAFPNTSLMQHELIERGEPSLVVVSCEPHESMYSWTNGVSISTGGQKVIEERGVPMTAESIVEEGWYVD